MPTFFHYAEYYSAKQPRMIGILGNEQKRIVAKIEELFAEIDKLK